jgi:DNA recombination protein RmuC
MTDMLLFILLALQLVLLALTVLALLRARGGGGVDPDELKRHQESLDRLQRDLSAMADNTERRLSEGLKNQLDEGRQSRMEAAEQARGLREESARAMKDTSDLLLRQLAEGSVVQKAQLEEFSRQLTAYKQGSDAAQKGFNDSVLRQMSEIAQLQKAQLDGIAAQFDTLRQNNERKLDAVRDTVQQRLEALQTDNAAKLEQMRQTVDEKLSGALEKRLGESFRQVSERLEQVHAGLGEMRNLASGVGDLKRVLTNVKARGTWGEIQLGQLLEQILTADQYATNIVTRPNSRDLVEFAIKLPGRDSDDPVYLPIDSKFPMEDYERLMAAAEIADKDAVEAAGKALENAIKKSARDIRDKYVSPPHTTDFGILFLPTEGLYAEVLRRPGLSESLQRELRIVVAGPTTLAALLNSLQMGFKTLAIEKRSSEVWQTLGAVKTEFSKFGDVLDTLKKQLASASNTIEKIATRKNVMQRKLKDVEALPELGATALLGESLPMDEQNDDEENGE